MISNIGTHPEMKSHGNQKLIKMKLCNNPRIIHHHPSCICLQETDYMDLIEILFYLHLNYLWSLLLDSYLIEKHGHIMWCKNVCVCVYLWAFLIYYSKCGVRKWSYIAIWRTSKGLSLIQFIWNSLARAELSIGLPLLMRSGVKLRVVGWLSSARWWF